MSSFFPRSTRSLAQDGFHRSIAGVLLAAALVVGWAVWLVRARVSIYASSDRARLEVVRAVHALEAPLTGRVASSRLALNLQVQEGEIVVELDAQEQQLALSEAQSRRDSLSHQVEVLRRQAAAQERAMTEDRQGARAGLEVAQARQREGEAVARHAAERLDRVKRLDRGGVAGGQELHDAQAEADRVKAAAEALAAAVTQLDWQLKSQESDRQSELEKLRAEAARAEGEIVAASAAIERYRYEIERRRIRAPIAGRLGDVDELRIGAVVAEGAKLAAVVPSGELKLAADFQPAAAVGRIRPGKRAWLSLHGFPSIQFGSIPATVDQVDSEIRDGHIRVEFSVAPNPSSAIPYEHGLPGTVEVEVDRISPATLVLRAAGQLLVSSKPAQASAAPEDSN